MIGVCVSRSVMALKGLFRFAAGRIIREFITRICSGWLCAGINSGVNQLIALQKVRSFPPQVADGAWEEDEPIAILLLFIFFAWVLPPVAAALATAIFTFALGKFGSHSCVWQYIDFICKWLVPGHVVLVRPPEEVWWWYRGGIGGFCWTSSQWWRLAVVVLEAVWRVAVAAVVAVVPQVAGKGITMKTTFKIIGMLRQRHWLRRRHLMMSLSSCYWAYCTFRKSSYRWVGLCHRVSEPAWTRSRCTSVRGVWTLFGIHLKRCCCILL